MSLCNYFGQNFNIWYLNCLNFTEKKFQKQLNSAINFINCVPRGYKF